MKFQKSHIIIVPPIIAISGLMICAIALVGISANYASSRDRYCDSIEHKCNISKVNNICNIKLADTVNADSTCEVDDCDEVGFEYGWTTKTCYCDKENNKDNCPSEKCLYVNERIDKQLNTALIPFYGFLTIIVLWGAGIKVYMIYGLCELCKKSPNNLSNNPSDVEMTSNQMEAQTALLN